MHKPPNISGIPVPYDLGVNELQVLTAEHSPSRWAAIEALAHHDEEQATSVLLQMLSAEDWTVRRAALEALSKRPVQQVPKSEILSQFDDESPFVVRTACDAAANLGLQDAHHRVLELLYDTEPLNRNAAAWALETFIAPGDDIVLLKQFDSETDKDIRNRIGYALVERINSANWTELFNRWEKEDIPRYRTWAAEIASHYGDRSWCDRLTTLATDKDGHVRKATERALANLQTKVS